VNIIENHPDDFKFDDKNKKDVSLILENKIVKV
jgi:hypothetical protein